MQKKKYKKNHQKDKKQKALQFVGLSVATSLFHFPVLFSILHEINDFYCDRVYLGELR